MIPYLLIIISALVGLVLDGVSGLIVGAALGFGITIVVGMVAWLASGGMVPRKTRRDTALNFIASNPDIVRRAYPDLSASEKLKVVEKAIESIFRRASTDPRPIQWLHSIVAQFVPPPITSSRKVRNPR